MSQSTEPYVPDGYYPPFAAVTDTDHSAYIIIAVSLGVTFVLLSSLIRIFLRISFLQSAGLDDTFLAAGTILAGIQSIVILAACSRGLGRSIDLLSQDAIDSVEKSYYASSIFVALSLAMSRCCVLMFVLRLTPIESHRRIAYGIITATALWAVGAVFSSALQCDQSRPWELVNQQCSHVYTRLRVVCIVDAILEAAIVICTLFMIRPLRTPASKKFVVVFVFSFRLPIIAIIALRLHTFNPTGLTTNFTFLETMYITLTQTQVNYSLISATIPNLRPIINNLNTHYGAMGESTLTGSNYNSDNSGNRTTRTQRSNSRRNSRRSSMGNVFAMGPLKSFKSKAKDSAHRGDKGNGNGLRGEEWDNMPELEIVPSIGTQAVERGSSFRVHIGHGNYSPREPGEGIFPNMYDAEGASFVSSGSRRMIIRKEVDIQVQTGWW